MIPEGSDVSDFWVAHPLGYPEFQLVDGEEEEAADDLFLESLGQKTHDLVSGEGADGAVGGSTDGDN